MTFQLPDLNALSSGLIRSRHARNLSRRRSQEAFTVADFMLLTGILALIVALMLNMVSQTSRTLKSTSSKIEQYRAAGDALDTMARRLSQATLRSYTDYDDPNNPRVYARQSELRFLSGPTEQILAGLKQAESMPSMAIFFQAPSGFTTNTNNSILQNALNTWGYYIEYGSDSNSRPAFLPPGAPAPRKRYRLMELMEPTENLSVYNYTTNRYSATNPGYTNYDWVSTPLTQTNPPVHVLAENVIAMIIQPLLANGDLSKFTSKLHPAPYAPYELAPTYVYNSAVNMNSNGSVIDGFLNTRNQLPPIVQLTLVAVDEASAVRSAAALDGITRNAPEGYGDLFQQSADYQQDIKTLEGILNRKRINYRIFTTAVMIKSANWSGSDTNK